MRRARLVAIVLGLGAAAGVAWLAGERRSAADLGLPERILIEEPVADLSAALDPTAVLAEDPAAPVHDGGLQPSPYLGGDGAYRRALVAPPPARLRFRVAVPPGAALRFAVGVEGSGQREPEAGGVRFTASVDGRPVFERALNPGRRRHHRRWFEARVDLAAAAGREAEIVLATDASRPGAPLGGRPGWSHVRVVRERRVARAPADPARPNVLVLLVDTLRADALGAYGAPAPTPVVDGLAARGLVFEDAVAQAPWTLPSVASIFTGLLPQSHGVVGHSRAWADAPDDAGGRDPSFLPDALTTLAERAREAGITTVGVSSNPLVSRGTNLAQGFETFLELSASGEDARWARAAEVNGRFLAWLRRNPGHRFFAWLHYMDVHDPYDPPEPFRPDPPPPGLRPALAAGNLRAIGHAVNWRGAPLLDDGELSWVRALYAGAARYWDAQLAALLDGLAAAGVLDATLVVVTSDHGETFQEHGRLKHGLQLYEELIRVPLILAGPGVPAGRARLQAQGIDLHPTLAARLGVPAPPGLPGQDLLAAAASRPAVSSTRWGILPDGRPSELVAVRAGGWKLIRAPGDGHAELYDLRRDPGERDDLFGRAGEAERLDALRARIEAEAPPPPAGPGRDPRLAEKLRALGYVE